MRIFPFFAGLLAAAFLGGSPAVRAGDGHDHGDAAPVASGSAWPRFTAMSETFELVGVVRGTQVTLYLDRAADNAPVTDAVIELEVDGAKLKVDRHEDTYEATLPAEPRTGVLAVTATVAAGQDIDLLAGELDLHEAAHAGEAAHTNGWREYAGWAVGAIAALTALILIGRRLAAGRQARTGAAA